MQEDFDADVVDEQDFFNDGVKATSIFLEAECDRLKAGFLNLKTRKDLASLLDIPYKILTYHLYVVPSEQRYKHFSIKKKSGGQRQISSPSTALKIIQRKLSQVLYCVYEPKPSSHGFTAGRSILTNAQKHSNKNFVFNLDLLKFFPSINFGRVRGMFMGKPFYLPAEVSTALAQICCYNNQLPQGAPTSPIISNMICAKLDSDLQKLAKKYKCTYTRYADDITFSTTLKTFPSQLARHINESSQKIIIGNDLINAIEGNGFLVNTRKVRLRDKNSRQEVTGLTVNEFPNVSRKYIRSVRGMLHAWEQYGLALAESKFYRNYYHLDNPSKFSRPPLFTIVLRSRIEFIGMVRGKNSSLYKKFLMWYWRLSNSSPS